MSQRACFHAVSINWTTWDKWRSIPQRSLLGQTCLGSIPCLLCSAHMAQSGSSSLNVHGQKHQVHVHCGDISKVSTLDNCSRSSQSSSRIDFPPPFNPWGIADPWEQHSLDHVRTLSEICQCQEHELASTTHWAYTAILRIMGEVPHQLWSRVQTPFPWHIRPKHHHSKASL